MAPTQKKELLEFLKHDDGMYHNPNKEQLHEINRYRQTTAEWLKEKSRSFMGLDQYLESKAQGSPAVGEGPPFSATQMRGDGSKTHDQHKSAIQSFITASRASGDTNQHN